MSYRNCLTAALAFSIAAALSAPAGAQTKEPVKLAIGVDAAYVPIYLSKQAKLFEKVGIVPGSVSEFSTEQMLVKYGIDLKSVEMVKAGPPEFPALLARGDVDGYFLWEPWPTNGIKQGGKILLTSGDVGYAYNMWLSANGAWLAAHQAEAKSMLAAFAEACEIVRADPAKGAAAVQAEAKIPAATAL